MTGDVKGVWGGTRLGPPTPPPPELDLAVRDDVLALPLALALLLCDPGSAKGVGSNGRCGAALLTRSLTDFVVVVALAVADEYDREEATVFGSLSHEEVYPPILKSVCKGGGTSKRNGTVPPPPFIGLAKSHRILPIL